MIFSEMSVGPMDNNCYIIGCEDTRQAAVIDPGAEGERIIKRLKDLKLECCCIILTHGHADHLGALQMVKGNTSGEVMIHHEDADMLTDPKRNLSYFTGGDLELEPADRLLNDGDIIKVGNLELEVIQVPGHTPGGICILAADRIITGDTLFAGGIGRSDFPGGSHQQLITAIKEKLFTLPPETLVFPGHGPSSSIGEEKKTNPYC
ncbi:MAG: MBL fold metallo-hydrolase [Peptococcaceae bacterium]|nr:MBL fold metallo-hydrolase [Peptococcaceae bacterium]